MGAWGTGSFDNDDAADFVYDVESEGVDAIKAALLAASSNDDYLEVWDGTKAIAAAEFVAAANGDTSGLDRTAREVFERFGRDLAALTALKEMARAAVERVMAPKSELMELWEEEDVDPDDQQELRTGMSALLQRLA